MLVPRATEARENPVATVDGMAVLVPVTQGHLSDDDDVTVLRFGVQHDGGDVVASPDVASRPGSVSHTASEFGAHHLPAALPYTAPEFHLPALHRPHTAPPAVPYAKAPEFGIAPENFGMNRIGFITFHGHPAACHNQ